MSNPLAGIKVLDLSRVLSGPYATMSLADLGADVVKVEHAKGDDTRHFGPPFSQGVATYFVSVNRGKRSIVADLKDPQDLATVKALAAVADVVISNFRPGVMARLGLSYETLKADNPGLVFCTISAFGPETPAPGYDLIVQGLSGIPAVTGTGEEPFKCGTSIADLVSGMNATQGILAALIRRERTGEGGRVDISMLDGQLALLSYHASAWLNAGQPAAALGNRHPSIHPYQAYRASDGWVNVGCGNNSLFAALCRELQVEWDRDPRFADNAQRVAHRDELDSMLVPRLLEDSVDGWVSRLGARGLPCGPMSTVPQALERATTIAHPGPEGEPWQTLVPGARISGAQRAATSPPPQLGAHRAEVLDEWLDGTRGQH
jgi:crotonobetainyl-CoA:carnitine CoA-transferase CaiB-like acyl-CoA transferase